MLMPTHYLENHSIMYLLLVLISHFIIAFFSLKYSIKILIKEMFYLTHSTHFLFSYIGLDIW